ncbi:hypothetical protein MNBD_GAMMA24-1494 [hydrothermal vent metagenome]|uniref:Cytochrome c domain-containing protein n=1 Tax=hydrothermal vent metagenome TaxID=652676 RepID=A0A3B1C4Y0_9ZZZZ
MLQRKAQNKSNLLFILPLLLTSLLATNTYAAGDASNGKALHDANCIRCHKSIMNGDPDSIYTRKDRRINSYQGLENQVNRCKNNIGIAWPQEQINDVVTYLNQQFYKFKRK